MEEKYPLFTEYMKGLDKFPFEAKQKSIFCHGTLQIKEGTAQKIPYDPRTKKLIDSSNYHDPAVYGSFDEMTPLLHPHMLDSECMSVAIREGLCAIRIEQCMGENGEMGKDAEFIMEKMESYTEASPDGAGITVFFQLPDSFLFDGSKYDTCNPDIGLTVYIEGHKEGCINLSGEPIRESGLETRGTELQEIMDKYLLKGASPDSSQITVPPAAAHPMPTPSNLGHSGMDDFELILRAKSAKNGDKFMSLMDGDTSEYGGDAGKATSALLCQLAFWTGRDAAQMDRIFRTSKLMSPLWDSPSTGNPDMTIGEAETEGAIQFTQDTYSPKKNSRRSAKQLIVHSEIGEVTLYDSHPEFIEQTDIKISKLFADTYINECRYVKERKEWFIFDGNAWRKDNMKAMELAKEFTEALLQYSQSLPDGNEQEQAFRTAYIKYVRKLQTRKSRETLLKDAASVYPIGIDEFDRDPYIFNCLNCTLDLRTMEAHLHAPEDLLTKKAGVYYNPHAKCQRWEQHMDEVTENDAELRKYMQKAFGYSLTGATNYECFFILYGPTSRNGKGTTMETIISLLNDYGRTSLPDSLAQKTSINGSAPNEDIARLAGARLVNFSEPDKQMALSASLVKTLTGSDTVSARYLHENSFEYKPTYKIFINTNYLPRTNDPTVFSSGRVKVLPFNHRFIGEGQDKNLKEELKQPESLSGILNWCIDGLRFLEAEGFDEPDSVKAATAEYEKASDKIGRFIEDNLKENPYGEILTNSAYQAYTDWCKANGQFVEKRENFNDALKRHNITIMKKRPKGNAASKNPLSMILGYSWQEGKEPFAGTIAE